MLLEYQLITATMSAKCHLVSMNYNSTNSKISPHSIHIDYRYVLPYIKRNQIALSFSISKSYQGNLIIEMDILLDMVKLGDGRRTFVSIHIWSK